MTSDPPDRHGIFADVSFVGVDYVTPDFAEAWMAGWRPPQPSPATPKAGAAEPQASRREQRKRVRNGLTVVKAAKKAGLDVKSATIDGVLLELGNEPAPPAANLTPLEEWKAKHRARSA